jgi:hypothetical protein
VKANTTKLIGAAAALGAVLAAGCGEVARNGRAPAMVIIDQLQGASGSEPDAFGSTYNSDVLTKVERSDDDGGDYFTVFSDNGRAVMRLMLRDPGVPGIPAAPSQLNEVTFTRYRVTYRRADGRNTPGVDVPYPFDSAATFTVGSGGSATVGFELVRHTAKQEAPLAALATSPVIISTIADVTFYGRDQAGNDVTATGSLGIFFGNFADE